MRHSISPWIVAFSSIACAAAGVRYGSRASMPADGTTLAPMLEGAMPAVVSIGVTGRVAVEQNPLFTDPFFHRFFEGRAPKEERQFQAAGSGVIVDAAKGLILTNNHLVQDADEIDVLLQDGTVLKADKVGTDPDSDVAVIKVDHPGLHAIPLGDSDKLKVGDWVVAIGDPFGLTETASHGMVSGLGRTGLGIGKYENFIQTDASINPGNSGGALVNLKGELVGINTAIVGPVSVGIGFAIPIDLARNVMKQLVETGSVQHGQLGVIVRDVSPDIARRLGLDPPEGAAILQIVSGSPAEKAGLKAGDVVTSIDGTPVKNSTDLRTKVGVLPVGRKLKLEYVRDGRKSIVEVAIGQTSA